MHRDLKRPSESRLSDLREANVILRIVCFVDIFITDGLEGALEQSSQVLLERIRNHARSLEPTQTDDHRMILWNMESEGIQID
jgi:hypothetical protein